MLTQCGGETCSIVRRRIHWSVQEAPAIILLVVSFSFAGGGTAARPLPPLGRRNRPWICCAHWARLQWWARNVV